MHTLQLIGRQIKDHWKELPSEPQKEICCVSGDYCDCVPRKKTFSSGFTSQKKLAAPESQWVSVEIYQAMKYRPSRSSWVVSENGFQKLTRIEAREYVLHNQLSPPWAGYITTSYKKHGGLIAPFNSGDKAVWLFETMIVDCSDSEKINRWYNIMDDALRNGIGRTIIETLEISPLYIPKIGIDRWIAFEKWARPKINDPLYKFLTYFMKSQEELKDEKKESVNKERKEYQKTENVFEKQLQMFPDS